jgi:MSHA biogenesis protein MshO
MRPSSDCIRIPAPPSRFALRRATALHTGRGFTLVELMVVIVLIGILGAIVAVFIANPVRAYFESIDRAALTDAAELAARRIVREVQGAVPNSVRVTSSGTTQFLEFVPVAGAGRYRAYSSNSFAAQNDPLDFSNSADNSFDILGPPLTIPTGAKLVIMNLGFGSMNLYSGANVRAVTSIGPGIQNLTYSAAGAWPAASPSRRFYLFTTAVSYVCAPNASGTGTLTRFSSYALQATQPSSAGAAPLSTATSALVLNNVSACSFTPGSSQADVNAMQVNLQLTRAGETVTLYSQVNAPNAP